MKKHDMSFFDAWDRRKLPQQSTLTAKEVVSVVESELKSVVDSGRDPGVESGIESG